MLAVTIKNLTFWTEASGFGCKLRKSWNKGSQGCVKNTRGRKNISARRRRL